MPASHKTAERHDRKRRAARHTIRAAKKRYKENKTNKMRRHITILLLTLCALTATAQERKVQNRPYTDLRPFHFGVVIGTHFQDIELLNAGPQTITADDGTTTEAVISADQDRWDAGFNVGVLGELRLSTHFQLRIAPSMYFGTRHLTFINHSDLDVNGKPREEKQQMKSAYISSAVDLIFAAPRFNNHRPYLMAGLNPMINLSGKSSDIIKLKRTDLYAEIGVGCDLYLPYFKLRPELKFMYGITDSLDKGHAAEMRDKNLLKFTNAVKGAHTKMIALCFYFE